MIQFRLPAPPVRPLPVLATIKRAYELLWENRFLEMRLVAAPFLLLTIAGAIQYRISLYFVTPDDLTMAKIQEIGQQIPIGLKLSWMASVLIGTALLIAFSVTWRRFLLLKEPPFLFYFQRPYWRYLALGSSFLAGLMALLIAATIVGTLVSATLGIKDDATLSQVVLVFLLLALAGFVAWIVRHILLFTAVAVDNRGLGWAAAAEAMQGNVLRYCLVWAALIAPIMLSSYVLAYLLVFCGLDIGTTIGVIIFFAVQSLVSVLQIALGASLGALIYDFLLRGGGPKQS